MPLNPRETLDNLLGLLGFVCQIDESQDEHGILLQVFTPEKERLIGHNGETLDDLQLLLNRLLQAHDKQAPKVHVDVEHYRSMRDDALAQRVRQVATIVRQTGRAYQLEPMNAYERRVVHNAFKDDPDIITWSPPSDLRLKRITLKKRA